MATRERHAAAKAPEARVGVVGLGIMGGGMAEALLGAGHAVIGYDPARSARARLTRAGGRVARSATAVAERADIVIDNNDFDAPRLFRTRNWQPRGTNPARVAASRSV